MAFKRPVIIIGGLTISFLVLVILTQTDIVIPRDEETDLPVDNLIMNEFTVAGKEYSFNVSTIKVSKGDIVKITFINNGSSPHNFGIEDFSARTPIVSFQRFTTIEFVADKTGTFDFDCSIPGHRNRGMLGSFIVE